MLLWKLLNLWFLEFFAEDRNVKFLLLRIFVIENRICRISSFASPFVSARRAEKRRTFLEHVGIFVDVYRFSKEKE